MASKKGDKNKSLLIVQNDLQITRDNQRTSTG